jgi:hypothetical protein
MQPEEATQPDTAQTTNSQRRHTRIIRPLSRLITAFILAMIFYAALTAVAIIDPSQTAGPSENRSSSATTLNTNSATR